MSITAALLASMLSIACGGTGGPDPSLGGKADGDDGVETFHYCLPDELPAGSTCEAVCSERFEVCQSVYDGCVLRQGWHACVVYDAPPKAANPPTWPAPPCPDFVLSC